MSATGTSYAEPAVESSQPSGLPRLLAGVPANGAMHLARHEAVHGLAPIARGRRGQRIDLIGLIEQAGLRGRGGAGFPTAAKMRAVAASRGRPVVLVNAAEGEPASRKDRVLTRALPHLVLDGAELAAQALGANELVLGVGESAKAGADSLAVAIAERGLGSGSLRVRMVDVPDRYVAGQESALVNCVNGASALPSFTPPMPFQRGVGGRPTLVTNVETLAHAALIARHGARWFRELGTDAQPGSALVTLSGPVAAPGVYEIALGESLDGLIDAAGGLTARARAVLLGGYGGTWVGAEYMQRLALAEEPLAPFAASLGAGVVLVLSDEACPVAEVVRLARWLAEQSAGQCGPCVHGLDAIAATLTQIAGLAPPGGGASERALATPGGGERVRQLAGLVSRRGACRHPDGAARMVLSALDVFAAEFADHAQHGPCERCDGAPELPL